MYLYIYVLYFLNIYIFTYLCSPTLYTNVVFASKSWWCEGEEGGGEDEIFQSPCSAQRGPWVKTKLKFNHYDIKFMLKVIFNNSEMGFRNRGVILGPPCSDKV